MPVCRLCQDFFKDTLGTFHQYRQNALIDATTALVTGASLTLTRIGRFLPGVAQVKNKIKRVDRLLGNESLQQDVPLIFNKIISMLTGRLSLCVIAVDWSGYPSQEYHVLRASLICDGRSIPLLSHMPRRANKITALFSRHSWMHWPEHLGAGTLSQAVYAQCDGHFYIQNTKPKGRKHKRAP